MSGTFGKLHERTLELSPGLNILQAPNETGKSTWCALLTAMLYGINSRERDRAGFIADKNRFAPWSGASMSGRLDCIVAGQALTITRTTRRQSAPMGELRALYAGTGEPVPDVTSRSCGEALLGVSREVFERSAFIRQNGLAISQDAELERRIAALITSGEEDTSYIEASEALRKQLNRRRYNKTGQIPALEVELAELNQSLAESDSLVQQHAQAQAQVDLLTAQAAALQEELAACDCWEAAQRRQAVREAAEAADRAEARAAQVQEQLRNDHIPENETIARLRGAIVNLETTRKAVDKARAERDEAMKALLRAEAAVNESPFAGQSPESARKEASAPPVPADWRKGPGLLLIALGTIAAFVLFYAAGTVLSGSPWQEFVSMAALSAGLCTTYVLAWRLRRRAIKDAQEAVLSKRFGTADLDAIHQLAETYARLCQARDAAQADVNAKSSAADTLYSSLSSNEQGILLEVRRFAPDAFDIPTADHLLRSCAVRRKELAEAESAAREARLRRDLQAQQAPEPEGPVEDVPAPTRDRAAISAEFEHIRAALADARSSADRLGGQLHSAGDPVVLRTTAEGLIARKDGLEIEYSAIRLAMEALERANTTLQNRFSPALGRRAAEIFTQLTDGRYTGVVLDRSFHLSAEPAGDAIFRDAALLSAGTLDQLYLAVRLAICDLVLPAERQVPIVLDDALANFDDDRCASALRFLKEAARGRQILLFTCHSREADFFAGDSEVSVQQLTKAVRQV